MPYEFVVIFEECTYLLISMSTICCLVILEPNDVSARLSRFKT